MFRRVLAVLPLLASLCLAGCARRADAPEATIPAIRTAAQNATTTATPTATATATATAGTGTTPTPATGAVARQTAVDGASVTISAVGDISLGRQVVDRMEAHGADYPFALIAPLITGDIGFANLEGPLTDRGEPWPKGYNFRTPPRFAIGLADARFDVVTLANNHAMDYGAVGLLDTIGALDAAGVKHAGAGPYLAQAWNPVIVEANGLRVAFLACVQTPNEAGGFDIHAWAAGLGDAPGIAVCDTSSLKVWIAGARELADFVIVAVHAGDEYHTAPNTTQRDLADEALAAGADIYLGAHAHVVQPVEQRGTQLVAWGLGNFIFDLDDVDLANIPEPRVSLILNITLTKGLGVNAWDGVPVTLDADEDRPRPATPGEAAAVRSLIGP